MRSLGVQFRTSAHGVTLSSLELVSKTTYDRKRVWCPPTPALPHLCSSTPSSRSGLRSCTHGLTPVVRRPRGCSEAGSRRLLCARVSPRWVAGMLSAGSARRTRDDGHSMGGIFQVPGPGRALT